MRILVASDAHLDHLKAADMVTRFHDEGDAVTVVAPVEHPHHWELTVTGSRAVESAAAIAHDAGVGTLGYSSGATTAERLAPRVVAEPTTGPTPNPALSAGQSSRLRVDRLLSGLADAGIHADVTWSPSVALDSSAVVDVAREIGAGLIVIGGRGAGRFDQRLGLNVPRLVRRAGASVIVVS